jgi:TonB family protein
MSGVIAVIVVAIAIWFLWRVMLRFIVNEDGSVDNVISGQPPLGFGLDEQSVRTVQQWRFTPAMLDGQPVKADVRAETTFCLY